VSQNPGAVHAGRLIGALNDAALMVMTSVGHRTGLFDALASLPPSTPEAIAATTGLASRYVREWLGVMASARVVEHDATTGRFRLPAEHAAFLTRAASPKNIAVTSQFIGVIAGVEDRIVETFRNGEGVHYHAYGRFHEAMAEDSAQTVGAALFEHILPLVPGLNGRLTRGIDAVDVGCGAGCTALLLAKAFPKSRFTGIDLCEDAFAEVQADAKRTGVTNLRFEARELAAEGIPGDYDLVTAFDAVHDQKDPQRLLSDIRAALRPDGVFLMQDIGGSSTLEGNMENPLATFLYTMSTMHCTPVSLAQGGPGLGTMWGVELATDMLRKAGFDEVDLHRLPHDPVNAYFVARG
jgi:2-polyprenyl-3-methyl-5-hydroxy-6-metoxy-1,4-benzoquinol methylase